ncbi:MAG: molybdenum cofactor guanylyltransferase [Verrucomicrobia bacterium]|nr:molybdenum cofactor guanylyltransferase [Verrucomicrobiota bacterium]
MKRKRKLSPVAFTRGSRATPGEAKTDEPPVDFEICILAGGLSRRMGRDKARLRLGRRTLLGHVRATAQQLGVSVRIIRRDLIPRCGPLGGVYAALKTTRAPRVIFLSCDMPFISATTIRRVAAESATHKRAIFFQSGRAVGFPFGLCRDSLATVKAQIRRREFSLQALARVLFAKRLRWPRGSASERLNVNTPEEYERARRHWSSTRGTKL